MKQFSYLVDTHCHLDLLAEKQLDILDILHNCKQNKVDILQTICTRVSLFESKILPYTAYDNIFCSVGIHPCYVQEEPEISSQQIVALVDKHHKIIGIGETGLDYYHNTNFVALQQKSFIEHIIASQRTQLPLIVHSRSADEDTINILQKHLLIKNFPVVLHCFSGSPKLAEFALKYGIYMSIAGVVTFKNALELQEVSKKIPLDLLLLETDSPYLAPTPYRGKINQPAHTLEVAKFVATLKNIDLEYIINATTNNFYQIFTRCHSALKIN
ncbi:MAG: TatD family deoxyribonuclease [Proteobacteria bacterium]|nr:TatD family deoxyribonuclease [Pseudomonadota bacterium]